LEWSRNGKWEKIAARLAAMVREKEGRDPEPSAGIIDARSVRASSTIAKKSKGFDAGKKINGRKTFGIVDTVGVLIAVLVVAANLSDNVGGIDVTNRISPRTKRFRMLWCDSGFKRTFIDHCEGQHITAEVVSNTTSCGSSN